jgi:hypothetical protein
VTYRIYVYRKGPKKGTREPGIYTKGEKFYVRVRRGNRDSMVYAGNSLAKAKEMSDKRREAEISRKLGVARDPDEAAKTVKVTVLDVIERYEKDGYADKKGNPRRAGKHLTGEIAYCQTLKSYFKGDAPAADLVQDDLDQYHDWRIRRLRKKHGKTNRHGKESRPPDDGPGTEHSQ